MTEPSGLHQVMLTGEQRASVGAGLAAARRALGEFDPSRPLSAHEALYGLAAALDPFYEAVYGAVLAAARESLAYPYPPPIEAGVKGELLEEALALQESAAQVLAAVADRQALDEQRAAFEEGTLNAALGRCLVAVVNLLDVPFPTKPRVTVADLAGGYEVRIGESGTVAHRPT